MNYASRKFYHLINSSILDKDDKDEFIEWYSCNYGFSHLKKDGITSFYEAKYKPLRKIYYKHIAEGVISTNFSPNDMFIEHHVEDYEDNHKYVPLTIYDLKYVKRGLECFLSDPIADNRYYGLVFLYLKYSNRMPKVKGLKHSIKYYKDRVKTPLDVISAFNMHIERHVKVVDSDGGAEVWLEGFGKDAEKLWGAFRFSKFGMALNEANH